MKKSAFLSDCRTYRFSLSRIWDEAKGFCVFIGLNPSTADENDDDPTIRRCVRFSADWGYGGLIMLNLFALRSTDPMALYKTGELIGASNDATIIETCRKAACIVCAWGAHGDLNRRGYHVISALKSERLNPCCLGLTKSGQPKHPLYLKASTKVCAL